MYAVCVKHVMCCDGAYRVVIKIQRVNVMYIKIQKRDLLFVANIKRKLEHMKYLDYSSTLHSCTVFQGTWKVTLEYL